MPRIFVSQFAHETNTFSKLPTEIADYEKIWLLGGNAIDPRFRNTKTEIGGYIAAAEARGWEIVHGVAANATPSGKLTKACWESIRDRILSALRNAGKVDAVCLALHGAMVTETEDDAEGALLEAIRGVVGPDIPVVTTLDLHANATERMAKHATALISYRTYPHIDQFERAQQATALVEKLLKEKARAQTVVVQPPTLLGADSGRTTQPGVMLDLLAKADAFEKEPGIHVVSVQAGFTPADIPWAGPSIAVSHDPSAAKRAKEIADELARDIWETRDKRSSRWLSIAELIEKIRADDGKGGPLVVGDGTDNPGGGAYGDGTNILKGLLDAGVRDVALGALCDPEAVQAGMKAGVGETVTIDLGGKIDPAMGGPPIRVAGKVRVLSNGDHVNDGPMHAGVATSMGPTMMLEVEGIDIVVCTLRLQTRDLQVFLSQGVDPRRKRTVVVKSVHHFRAAFAPIAREVVTVDSGALCTPDVTRPKYTKLRPVWPLDPSATY